MAPPWKLSRSTTSAGYGHPINGRKLHFLKKHIKPVLASFIASLGSMVVGSVNGYSSPAIPNLNEHSRLFKVNPEESSWFGSIIFLADIPGVLYSGWIIDRYGRKLSLMMASIPFVFGFVVIVAARHIYMLYIGRMFTGFALTLMQSTVGVYITEISPPLIRPLLLSISVVATSIGILLDSLLGKFLTWNWVALVCASISCLHMLLLLFIPETPRWLILCGQKEEAINSIIWFHNNDVNVEEEINNIEQSIAQTGQPPPLKDYFKKPLWKSFYISQFLFLLQQLSGINVVRLHTVGIFTLASNQIEPNTQSITVGTILVIGSGIATVIIDHYQRRSLLIISSIIMGLSLSVTGAYFKIKEIDATFAVTCLYWLPLVSLGFFTIGVVLGCGPLPIVITNELFPARARGRAVRLGIVTQCISSFIMTKLFLDVCDVFGEPGAFWLCTAACFFVTLFVIVMVPNTCEKTKEESQQNIEI